ncbi:putative fatty acyl-CoA reductase CG5065 [Hyalella azteca]|uniref:Fatty acyl-CoA reductase n=1 Tax=Hyalella azteca TaxID=294128 RepID=A0A8B7P9J8_HYAAZ|nr:putative fatty acyl-CoA reductase CG5065 [Hyalella azteca]
MGDADSINLLPMIAPGGNRRAAAQHQLPSPIYSGPSLNGCIVVENGHSANGSSAAGLSANGSSFNGLSANGPATNGSSAISPSSNAPETNGPSVEAKTFNGVPSTFLSGENNSRTYIPNGDVVNCAPDDGYLCQTNAKEKDLPSISKKFSLSDSVQFRSIEANYSDINSPNNKVEIIKSLRDKDSLRNGSSDLFAVQSCAEDINLSEPCDRVSRNCTVVELGVSEDKPILRDSCYGQVNGSYCDLKKSDPAVTLNMPPNTTNARGAAGPAPSTDDVGASAASNGPLGSESLSSQLMHSPHHLPQFSWSGVESVAEFYRGRALLITGATGFMGKVLVEKLLRSCPAVGKIFLLMRSRGTKDVQTRLQELLKSQVFDTVHATCPEALLKVAAVEGDILEPGLGLSEADTQMLVQNVSVVFHAAATVKFDEVIKLSLKMNVLGVKRIIELCKKMKNLVSLVHVSTAYCNCDRNEVEELVYDPPSDAEALLKLIDLMDDDLFNHLTPKLIGKRPNTYTFTKALAEHVLVTEARDLPVAIVRPSIVSAAWREPIPGWVDNLNGPTGLIVGVGKGMLRSIHCHGELVADLIPVDIPINLLIVTACYTAMRRSKGEMKVYNCVSGMERPMKWREMTEYGMVALKTSAAMTDAVWYPSLNLSDSRHINAISVIIQHWAPAYVLDAIARIAGKRPM